MRRVLPKYFSSEWSFAFCHLEEVGEKRCICTFGQQPNRVIRTCCDECGYIVLVLSCDGFMYQVEYDPLNGGECRKVELHRYLDT